MAFWLFGLAACGGGGGSSPQKPDGNNGGIGNTGNSNPVSNGLNPNLPGKLFYQTDDDTALLFDFETGITESIPNTNWEDHQDMFPSNDGGFSAFPDRDGEQWTVVVDKCGLADNGGGCLRVQDKFGNYTDKFLAFNGIKAILAQLSPDGNYVIVEHRSKTSDDEHMTIYDFSGKNLGVYQPDEVNFDWLPDNRLVLIDLANANRQFRFTRPASFDIEFALELPREVTGAGTIGGIEVSPDGNHIAFRLNNESEDKKFSIWTMEIATGALVRVAEASEGIRSMGFPRWSPDGNYLSVLGSASTGLINFLPTPESAELTSSLFVLPLEKLGEKPFVLSQFDDKSSEVIELKRRFGSSNQRVTKSFDGFGGYSWIE